MCIVMSKSLIYKQCYIVMCFSGSVPSFQRSKEAICKCKQILINTLGFLFLPLFLFFYNIIIITHFFSL
jgi:hypothetical protein